MRVNIYQEEITGVVNIVEKTPEDKTFYGVQVILKSHGDLNHTPDNDDRSAVTFWVTSPQRAEILRDHLRRDLKLEAS